MKIYQIDRDKEFNYLRVNDGCPIYFAYLDRCRSTDICCQCGIKISGGTSVFNLFYIFYYKNVRCTICQPCHTKLELLMPVKKR